MTLDASWNVVEHLHYSSRKGGLSSPPLFHLLFLVVLLKWTANY